MCECLYLLKYATSAVLFKFMKLSSKNCFSVVLILLFFILQQGFSLPVRLKRELVEDSVVSLCCL